MIESGAQVTESFDRFVGEDETEIAVAAGTPSGHRGRGDLGPADLMPGDSIHHDAAQPHVYEGAAADNRALLLMIYS
jgi:hypothetical protein